MQYHAIQCNTMQYHAIPCNTMQYHAIQCNTIQYHAIPCNTMQYYAIPCNTMQYRAILCITMQYHAIPCNTMQYHAIPECRICKICRISASLITADGAYHCPLGSIWLFFPLLSDPEIPLEVQRTGGQAIFLNDNDPIKVVNSSSPKLKEHSPAPQLVNIPQKSF